MDASAPDSPSAREEFLRSLPTRTAFEDRDIRLAEEVDAFYPESPYTNLIEFEIDIAQASDVVLLFSEGYGSLAELGAFSQIPQIAERMLVIVQSVHYDNVKSFVRDGPIRHLETNHQNSVEVFDWHTQQSSGPSKLDSASFRRHLADITNALKGRFEKIPVTSEFDPSNFAHKIIITTAIADAFGAATFDDFKEAFISFGVPTSETDIHRMLFSATAVKWLQKQQRGHRKFYIPTFEGEPCSFAYKKDSIQKDTIRWKRDIRDYWKKHDAQRYYLITDHLATGAKA